jgi:hypothetical protein
MTRMADLRKTVHASVQVAVETNVSNDTKQDLFFLEFVIEKP